MNPTEDEVQDYLDESQGETDSEGHDTFYRRLAKAYLELDAENEDLRVCVENRERKIRLQHATIRELMSEDEP